MKKIIILITLVFVGCSNIKIQEEVSPTKIETLYTTEDFKLHLNNGSSNLLNVYDPFESMNRRVYYFNYQFDNWVALPVSNSYKFFLPQTIRTGVGNFFSNLYEPISAINGVLILDSKTVFTGVSRFLINTTVGVAGLFDVATLAKIPKHKVTLNDTMIVYGVKNGPYLILPFLGPSDLRNASSLAITSLLKIPMDPINIYGDSSSLWDNLAVTSLEAADLRNQINFRYYSLGTPFEYEYVRLLYLRSTEIREKNIKKK